MKQIERSFHVIELTYRNSLIAGGKSYRKNSRKIYKIKDLDSLEIGDVIIIKRVK